MRAANRPTDPNYPAPAGSCLDLPCEQNRLRAACNPGASSVGRDATEKLTDPKRGRK